MKRAVLACVLLAAGCGSGGASPADAREVDDAATTDAPVADAPATDASEADAAVVDASEADAAMSDAEMADASEIDARPDAAMIDASIIDAAMIDARPDAAMIDARPDAAPIDAAPDARPVDAMIDAAPPPDAMIDAAPPPDAMIDATPPPDAYVAPPITTGVWTLAGTGFEGFADGDRNTARFANPANVALGPDGKIYVADFDNNAIRRVDTAGNVDTVYTAANFQRPFGLAFAADGSFYACTDNDDAGQHSLLSGTIWKIDTTAKTATVVIHDIGRCRGLAALPDGRLAISDHLHQTIRTLDPTSGTLTIIAGAQDVADYANGTGAQARFNTPYGLAVITVGGNPVLVVADYANQRLREVALDGTTSTLTGDGNAGYMDGDVSIAELDHPEAVAADANGSIYVTDTDNFRVRRIASGTTTVDTVAGNGTGGYLDSNDRLAAELFGLEGVCATADGKTLYVADGNRGDAQPYDRVRVVDLAP